MADWRLAVAFAEAAFFAAFFFLLRAVASFSDWASFVKRSFAFALIAGFFEPIPAKGNDFSYSSDMLHTQSD